jgi:hypothetical protein
MNLPLALPLVWSLLGRQTSVYLGSAGFAALTLSLVRCSS